MKSKFKGTGRTEHHCPKCHELQGGVKISDRYYYHRTYGEGYQEKFFKCKFCGYIWGRTDWFFTTRRQHRLNPNQKYARIS